MPAGPQRGDGQPALLDLHLAAEEHEQLVARLALADDGLRLLELPASRDAEDGEQLLVGHVLEERDAAEDLGLALDVAGLLVLVGFDGETDRGDVVLAAPLQRQVDQQVRQLVALLREQLRQLVVLQVAVETVRAEDEEIAGQQICHQRVDRDRGLDSDRAGDDVLVFRRRDLLLGDQPALELFLDDGVVLGELVRAAIPVEIDAAVADVPDHRLPAGGEQRDHGRSHAALAQIASGDRIDVGAGLVDGALHQRRDLLARLDGGRFGESLEDRLPLGERVADRFHRLRAGDLARGMPAHAISDRVQSEVLVDEKGVLVVLALVPDVGAGPTLDDGHRLHCICGMVERKR